MTHIPPPPNFKTAYLAKQIIDYICQELVEDRKRLDNDPLDPDTFKLVDLSPDTLVRQNFAASSVEIEPALDLIESRDIARPAKAWRLTKAGRDIVEQRVQQLMTAKIAELTAREAALYSRLAASRVKLNANLEALIGQG